MTGDNSADRGMIFTLKQTPSTEIDRALSMDSLNLAAIE